MGTRNLMFRSAAVTLPLCLSIAWCRQEPKLTPRELFYSAPPAPAAAPSKKLPAPRPARNRPAPPREPLAVESRTPAPARRVQEPTLVPVVFQDLQPAGSALQPAQDRPRNRCGSLDR